MAAPWDGRLVTYLGYGDAANRPTTPNIAPGLMAFYYATDTNVLSLWDGAWETVGGSGGGGLLAANNLSDVANAATSRTNLGLGSAAEADSTDFLAVDNNLSDLDTPATARTNLDVYSTTESDALVEGLLDLKGGFDASLNPDYPAGEKGDTYIISVAGTIDGDPVAQNDLLICILDTVGEDPGYWLILRNGAGNLLAANNLSDVDSASTARENLGLKIGTDVQAYSSVLTSFAGLIDPDEDSLIMWDDSEEEHVYFRPGTSVFRDFSNSALFDSGAGGTASNLHTISEAAVNTHLLTFYLRQDNNLSELDDVGEAQANLKMIDVADQTAMDAILGGTPDADAYYFVKE